VAHLAPIEDVTAVFQELCHPECTCAEKASTAQLTRIVAVDPLF
jgi:hypothetical protein